MSWKLVAAAGAAVMSMGFAPAPPASAPAGHGVAPLPQAQSQPQPQPHQQPGMTGFVGPKFYLSGAAVPDIMRILPPAPQSGDARYEADRKMFQGTRNLENTPRWAMATNDDNSAGLVNDLACALGVELTRQNAPKLMSMIPRIGIEAVRATNVPKDAYKRLRPFLIDQGPTCIDQTGLIKDSYDYPSGHNTYGWAVGLILAELAPDRAADILVRARAFGESRLVCGVHNMSAVEAGRTNGSILVAALHSSPEFRADLAVARRELAAARKAGPAPNAAACAKEAELSKSVY
jgi:acid phosphatase (class A)